MSVTIPHADFAWKRGPNGKIAVVEQDSLEHVMACEQVIIYCPLGARPERPGFGWTFPYMRLLPIDSSGPRDTF